MDFELRELRCFVTAADAGSFTEAAARLFISQAAVSRTIAGLERTLGVRLLRRVPRGCELTSAGQQLIPHARRVLADAEVNLPPAAKPDLLVKDGGEVTQERLERYAPLAKRLGRLERIDAVAGDLPQDAVSFVVDEATFGLPLKEVLDIGAEKARLGKEIAKLTAEMDKLDRKLGNQQFLDKAPLAVVEEQRSRKEEVAKAREKLEASLTRLAAL